MDIKQINKFKKILELATQQLLLIAQDLKRKTQPNLLFWNRAKSYLGKDIAPLEDEYGCMEAVNSLVRGFTGKSIGGGLSTYLGYRNLKVDKRFIQVRTPALGDIVISPSGYGNGVIKNGHIGVISDGGKIMSNNSKDGLWSEHLTLSKWNWKYKRVGGFPIFYYRLISK